MRELGEETKLVVARDEIENLGGYDDGERGYRYVLVLRRRIDPHELRVCEGTGAVLYARDEIMELRGKEGHLANWLPDCFVRFDLWSLWP